MMEHPDTTRVDAAAARARIETVLKRLAPTERIAFWKAVHACYTPADLATKAEEGTTPRSGSAPGPGSGSGS